MALLFAAFLETVPQKNQPFVTRLHTHLSEKGCTCKIKEAKSGYTASYLLGEKTIMNWVFRKTGMQARIYGDHVHRYEDIVHLCRKQCSRR